MPTHAMPKQRLSLAWSWGAAVIALPIAVPILAILLAFVNPTGEVWQHLLDTVLWEYIGNTLLLLFLVAILATAMGVLPAWIVATREFPGRTIFAWALIIPIAAPAYVVAYAYADLLSFNGPVHASLTFLGFQNVSLPAIRSLSGAAFVLAATLYPYIYLFAVNAFSQQAQPLTEAARMLGANSFTAFWRVAAPLARPAIVGGLALVLMETAADFGVVEFFGVPTLTNGIFRTWYAQGEQVAAMQLAGCLFVVVALLVVLEQLARRGLFANPVSRNFASARSTGSTLANIGAIAICTLPILLGFLLPGSLMLYHVITTGDPMLGRSFSDYLGNSITIGIIAALCATACAIWLSYALRMQQRSAALRVSVRVATLGYAIPGMVLAVGLIGPLTTLDKAIAETAERVFSANIGLVLTGSAAVLVFAYLARFMTVAFNSCEGGLAQIHPNYDAAARSLGAGSARLMRRIHLPLLTPSLLTAVLLVFVDVIKELPATLILRPFNFETLATRAYRLASDERVAEASTASLLIIVVGLVPAALIAWQNFSRRGPTQH